MKKIDETEQWKLSGNCSKCRRKNYCSKECARYNRRINAEIYSLVANKLNEMTGGAYGDIMSRLNRKGE